MPHKTHTHKETQKQDLNHAIIWIIVFQQESNHIRRLIKMATKILNPSFLPDLYRPIGRHTHRQYESDRPCHSIRGGANLIRHC